MWANDVTHNLDRSTWDDLISAPPPSRILELLRASDSRVEAHLNRLRQSTRTALTCMNGCIAEVNILRRDWEAYDRRLEDYEQSLRSRKEMIEASLDDINLPDPSEVGDSMEHIENVEDLEHQ
ncbi:hypothetical protein PF005_g976 [Phytophthora fragariae]|uniref:Uncharacterized protein n=2 Tax=Phytophthora fragariae TaxID=53985 RepID=A0A6A3FID9_9STRA|nr:hypothetical protein PF003_g1470 [Phytophthora fragariae]KAE8944982.1 hypothetical protein PF009_g5350 [Phytophthora fragariae]KAE9021422.1 hypothetical protein PF011_g4948 [Phytophthora fragariae]KAE9125886.1 hypothetical protein PF010_g5465 [Phytophthora fragariae]KAE9129487.1 hypothetical protein PF007_g4861 [Phytophthora fragariae]